MEIISIHALREEGDLRADLTAQVDEQFLSTPSARRATSSASRRMVGRIFLSTPSARRATLPPAGIFTVSKDFYPRPPRGGRHATVAAALQAKVISIHALREEGDVWRR